MSSPCSMPPGASAPTIAPGSAPSERSASARACWQRPPRPVHWVRPASSLASRSPSAVSRSEAWSRTVRGSRLITPNPLQRSSSLRHLVRTRRSLLRRCRRRPSQRRLRLRFPRPFLYRLRRSRQLRPHRQSFRCERIQKERLLRLRSRARWFHSSKRTTLSPTTTPIALCARSIDIEHNFLAAN